MGFTGLLNKGLANDVVLAKWCPTMDLLAIVASNNTLSVHRLNWQRLWSLPLPCTVTALCWKGDGKMLAVGFEDGSYQLLHAEDGGSAPLQHTFAGSTAAKSLGKDPLVSLSWTAHDLSSRRHTTRVPLFGSSGSTRVCPGMESLLDAQNAPDAQSADVADSKLLAAHAELAKPSMGSLNIVCASSGAAQMSLYAFGDFLLAELEVEHPTKPAALTWNILHAELIGDLRRLCTIIQHRSTGRIDCQVHNVSCIADLSPELTTLTRQHHQLTWYYKACEEALNRGAKAWEGAMRCVQTDLQKLQALLADYSIDSTSQAELCVLLTTGRASAALQQFLTAHLGDAGVKRLARGVDSAVQKLHGLLVDVMQPGLEAIAFALSDIAGLARCSPWTAPLSLKEDAVQEAVSGAHALILQAEALRLTVDDAVQEALSGTHALILQAEALRLAVVGTGVQYRTLFAWLLTTVRRMSNDEPSAQRHHFKMDAQALSEFTHGQLFHDSIGPQLQQTQGAAQPLVTPTPGVQELLKLFQCDPGSMPLHMRLHQLRPSFQAIFAPIPQALAADARLIAHVHLATLTTGSLPRMAFKALQEEGQAALLCLACGQKTPDSPMQILVARIGDSQAPDHQDIQVCAGVLEYECDGQVQDIGLYKNGAMAVLSGGDGQHYKGRLALLPSAALARQRLPEAALRAGPILTQRSALPSGGKDTALSWSEEGEALQIAPREAAMSWQSEGVRSIELPAAQVHAPLAVSAERGVACAFVGVQRAVVLDLEDDNDEEAAENADSSDMEES